MVPHLIPQGTGCGAGNRELGEWMHSARFGRWNERVIPKIGLATEVNANVTERNWF